MQENIQIKGGQMKIILVRPYAMEHKKSEVLNEIYALQDAKIIRSKKIIVNSELVEKHFHNLPNDELKAISTEWSGTVIEAMIVEGEFQIKKEILELVYISESFEKGAEDIKLWFPEF